MASKTWRAGAWVWVVAGLLAACGGPGGPAVGVTVAPLTATLAPGASRTFTATVTGATDPSVAWSATCGVVTGSGATVTYTAPGAEGACTVRATSVEAPSRSGTATVTIAASSADVSPGTTVWDEILATVAAEDEVLAVASGPDGVVAYGGLTYGTVGTDPNQGGADGFVVLLEADGSERWRVAIGDVGEDRVADLAVRADGVVLAVGTIEPSADGGDAFAFALDGATGATLWKRAVITPEADAAVAVVVAADGTAFVAGHTRGTVPPAVNAGNRDAFVLRVTPAGVTDGYLQFGGPGFEDAVDLVRLPDGDVVLVGSTGDAVPGATGAGQLFAARFAPDLAAAPSWVIQSGATLDVVPGAAAVDPDGDVVVVGQVSGQVGSDPVVGDYDVFVARLAAGGGAPTYVRQVGTVGYDTAGSVAVDAAGRVWVAGSTTVYAPAGDTAEAVLYVFGPDDALLRREVVPAGAFAGANALALVADREVVVGGWSAAAAPGDRSGWDGFVVRRRHAP